MVCHGYILIKEPTIMQNLMTVLTRKWSPRAEGIFLIGGGIFLAAAAVATIICSGAELPLQISGLILAAATGAYWHRAYVLITERK